MLDRSCGSSIRSVYVDPVSPPLTSDGINAARANIRKLAKYFIGTDTGRALAEADRHLSSVKIIPDEKDSRQRERGLRIRYIRSLPRYAECKSVRSFAKAFRHDADHYLKNRSKYDDPRAGRPRDHLWLSIAHVIDLCEGEIPSFNSVRRDS